MVSCQSRSANPHTGADQGSLPFRQRARCFAAKDAIEAAGADGQGMAVDGSDVASRKVSLAPVSGTPRLRCSKLTRCCQQVPPVPQALPIAGAHQGPLFLASPAFLQEPGHAVGPALPWIQLD